MITEYTALIRTNNSLPLVEQVVAKLKSQSFPPKILLCVDSHSSPEQQARLSEIFDLVIEYPADEDFNYSKAINIGVEACSTPYVLIISSHVLLESELIIEHCTGLLTDKNECLGFSVYESPDKPSIDSMQVNIRNFSPLIGLSNSCAYLRVADINARPFREDVFSAEDQEWVAYYIRNHNAHFFSVGTHDMKYLNQYTNDLKKINEEISMAYFTHPHLRSPKSIVQRFLRAILAYVRKRPERAKLHMTIAKELFLSYFRKPSRKSKYY